MALLWLAGELFNVAARGTLTVSSEDSVRPKENLFNYRPAKPFRFGALGTDDYASIDLDFLLGAGGFEGGVGDWSGSGGTFAQDGTVHDAGSYSGKLTHTAAASRYIDVTVRAGERLWFLGKARGDASATGSISIQCLETGYYLTGAAAWTTTPTTLVDQTAASFASGAVADFTVQALSVRRFATVTLRITVSKDATNGDVWFDSIAIGPWWDFLSLHGHNLGPVTPRWQSATDGVSFSTLKSPDVYSPSFYSRLSSPVSDQYVQLLLEGTNHKTLMLGELVVGLAYEPAQPHDWGISVATLQDVIRSDTTRGQTDARSVSEFDRHRIEVSFAFDSHSDYEEQRDELIFRSRGPVNPFVMVPDDARPEVYHARFEGPASHRRTSIYHRQTETWAAAEQPFFASQVAD